MKFVCWPIILFHSISTGFSNPKPGNYGLKQYTKRALMDFSVSYGDFNGAIFNKRRNIYFWPHNMNILPISKEKAQLASRAWIMGLLNEDNLYKEDYDNFKYCLDHHQRIYYKWVPYENKDNIKALVAINLNTQEKKIMVREIIFKPFTRPNNFDLLIDDLEHITLSDGLEGYNLELNTITLNRKC